MGRCGIAKVLLPLHFMHDAPCDDGSEQETVKEEDGGCGDGGQDAGVLPRPSSCEARAEAAADAFRVGLAAVLSPLFSNMLSQAAW